jgi:hypothetical protein
MQPLHQLLLLFLLFLLVQLLLQCMPYSAAIAAAAAAAADLFASSNTLPGERCCRIMMKASTRVMLASVASSSDSCGALT